MTYPEVWVVRADEDGLRRVLPVVDEVLPQHEGVGSGAGARDPDRLPDDPDDLLRALSPGHQDHHCREKRRGVKHVCESTDKGLGRCAQGSGSSLQGEDKEWLT